MIMNMTTELGPLARQYLVLKITILISCGIFQFLSGVPEFITVLHVQLLQFVN